MKQLLFGILLSAGCLIGNPVHAQVNLTSESMGLGGGGTAYLSGYEALFSNPANLYIQEKNYSLQVSVFQTGYYYNSLLPEPGFTNRFNNYLEDLDYFTNNSTFASVTGDDIEKILERSFNGNRLTREFSTISDIHWVGLKWVRPNRSYALSLRSRIASQFEIGRGFYDPDPVEVNGDLIVDQSLKTRYQALHELSFGFAESFTYLNGLLPRLSEFIVGVAPKIVVSGSYIESDYTNRFRYNPNNDLWFQTLGYSQQTAGAVSPVAGQETGKNFGSLLNPSGIGGGLDVGLTYFITFDDDFSVYRQANQPTETSLRLSFSITDLGVIYHYESPHTLQTDFINSNSSQLSSPTNLLYTGRPNQHLAFLMQQEDFQKIDPTMRAEGENFWSMLPMSLNAGAMYHYKQFKVMGDLSYSVVKSAFNHTGFTSYFGMEVRPVHFLPIRGGVRLAPHLQGFYSVGTGIETQWFDINASVLFRSKNSAPTSEILGASVVGIKMYFQ